MQPFTKLTAIAAPLPMTNVDTDKIIPAKWLKTIKRTGLGVACSSPCATARTRSSTPSSC